MSGALPIKKEKRPRPNDADNSFVKNVTSRVSGLLPSIITKWFSCPSSSNANGSATFVESSHSSTEDEASENCNQPPAKRMRYTFECDCRSPSTSSNSPEMKCTSSNTESIETYSSVQSPVGYSTFKPETSLLAPKEETTISEHENDTSICNLPNTFPSNSFVEKRKSLFGGPIDEKLSTSDSFRDNNNQPGLFGSPFYPGQTRYGGAANSYTNQANIKHRKNMLISSSANNDSIAVGHVTRRVMDLLDNYSSPLIEAKRISQFSRSHINSLDNTHENNAYKTKELYVPKLATILKLNCKSKLMGTTSAARQIIASNSSSSAFQPYPASKSHSNSLKPSSEKLTTKIKTKFTRFSRDDQKLNDNNTTVQLPTAILQIGKNDLPKFTLQTSVADTSTTSETLFISSPTSVATKTIIANNVTTTADISDNTELAPTPVIIKEDNVSMNKNEVGGKPQTYLNDNSYKFSKPDMILNKSVQNSSTLPKYMFCSLEKQIVIQSKDKENETKKNKENEEQENEKFNSIISETKINQCSECKITLNQENNGKCIECKQKINIIDKIAPNLTLPISSKWKCQDCWVENEQGVNKCVCCGGSKHLNPNVINAKCDIEWQCQVCQMKNRKNVDKCISCGELKHNSKTTTRSDVSPTSTATNIIINDDEKFKNIIKLQKDRWECSNCLVCNDNNRSKCVCCDAERAGTFKESEKKSFNFGNIKNTTFKFGINPNENIPEKKPELSSVSRLGIETLTESETNNNVVPKPLNFNFGISKPKSNNVITEEKTITEDRIPSPEQTFNFGISKSFNSKISTTANVFINPALSTTKGTESVLMSNSTETDEKLQEVPNIEEPNSTVLETTVKSGELFCIPSNNSPAHSSIPALITFGATEQSSNTQEKQAVTTTTTVGDAKVPQSTFSFSTSGIKAAVNSFSANVTPASTSCVSFSSVQTTPVSTVSFFQKDELNPKQSFFPKSASTPTTLSLFSTTETITTTVATSSNTQLFSFGGNNQNKQSEKPKFNFTFGNKSEVPSLFASPISTTNSALSGNVLPETNTVSGTVMSGGNGLATTNSIGGNGLPINSLSSGLLAGPAKKDDRWPSNSNINSFKMPSGNNIETSVNNVSSIQSGNLFGTQPKKEIWPTNQNASNDSHCTLKLSSGNQSEPITDSLRMPTGPIFGAAEMKDTMWSQNNNNTNNMFGTNASTNNLQKGFSFGSSGVQFPCNTLAPSGFGNSVQPVRNIFGSYPNNNNLSLFTNPIQNQTPPTIFGAQPINNSTPSVAMFGAPNAAANSTFGTLNQPISTFETPQLNPVPTPTFNFGAQQTTGVFGFGQQQPQPQIGVYNFGAQPVGSPQRQFNIGTTSAPNTVGRRVIRKAVRRTPQR